MLLFLFGGPSHIDLWDMKPSAPAEIRGLFRPMATRVAELKDLMNRKLYRHFRVLRMTQKAARVVTQLFEAYMAEPAQIPPHIAQRMNTQGDSTPRVIADYIAGMTDRFALDEYGKLFDPNERV